MLPVRKSCVAAMSRSPFLGVTRLDLLPMRTRASALASSVWGRWRFISSPSKSALYGVHTHSLNLVKKILLIIYGSSLTRNKYFAVHSPESPPLKNLGPVAHDGDPVQGRLTVEQDQVVVDHVTLNNVAGAEVLRDLERLKWVTHLNHVTQKKVNFSPSSCLRT